MIRYILLSGIPGICLIEVKNKAFLFLLTDDGQLFYGSFRTQQGAVQNVHQVLMQSGDLTLGKKLRLIIIIHLKPVVLIPAAQMDAKRLCLIAAVKPAAFQGHLCALKMMDLSVLIGENDPEKLVRRCSLVILSCQLLYL